MSNTTQEPGPSPGGDAAAVPEATEPSSLRAGWTAVIVFQILYCVAFLDRQIITLLVEPIKRDLQVTDFQISILQGAAFIILYTAFAIPIGWMVDRFPRRWIVFTGIIVWSIGAAACGLARNYWQLLAARSTVGAGEASLSPSAYSMLSDLFPKDRLAVATSVFSTGAMVGSGLSLIVGGLLVGLASNPEGYHVPILGWVRSWQLVFLVTGLPGLALAFLVFLVKEPKRRGTLKAAPVRKGVGFGALLKFMSGQKWFYICHIMGFSLLAVVSTGYASWGPTFLMRTFDWPVQKVGSILGAMSVIGGVAGGLTSGWLADFLLRRGYRDAHLRVYMWFTLIVGVVGVVGSLSRSVPVVLTAIFLEKFFIPFIAVAATALQITTPNQYRGQVSAVFLFFYNIVGYGFGATLIAAISDFWLGGPEHIGLAIALTFGILCPVVAIIFALGLKPMRRAVGAAEAWSS